ncbi:MAG: hypothetical protein Q7U04_06880 [Bacteriovorax sp.]|nr:hypothetical protein [Bacteriovorax sp.]
MINFLVFYLSKPKFFKISFALLTPLIFGFLIGNFETISAAPAYYCRVNIACTCGAYASGASGVAQCALDNGADCGGSFMSLGSCNLSCPDACSY